MTATEQERERETTTGYGKGWREPKAKGLVNRFKQRMREPATTTTYYIAGFIFIVFVALV